MRDVNLTRRLPDEEVEKAMTLALARIYLAFPWLKKETPHDPQTH